MPRPAVVRQYAGERAVGASRWNTPSRRATAGRRTHQSREPARDSCIHDLLTPPAAQIDTCLGPKLPRGVRVASDALGGGKRDESPDARPDYRHLRLRILRSRSAGDPAGQSTAASDSTLTLAERQAAWSAHKNEYRRRLLRDGQASADRWLDAQALASRGTTPLSVAAWSSGRAVTPPQRRENVPDPFSRHMDVTVPYAGGHRSRLRAQPSGPRSRDLTLRLCPPAHHPCRRAEEASD